jgi:hypothetical protein
MKETVSIIKKNSKIPLISLFIASMANFLLYKKHETTYTYQKRSVP